MADFVQVPVLDVITDNCQETWPALLLATKSSTFVAIDMELSGLGNRRKLNPKSMDDRYDVISNVARSRSVLSIGISCFKLLPEVHEGNSPHLSDNVDTPSETEKKKVKVTDLKFQVQTFNIILLCSEEYVVDPSSLKFLVEHGFDFNKQYSKGVPYYSGSDKKTKDVSDSKELLIRELFKELIKNETPVVFHNALVDLVFLYQSFYANLPSKISMFLADMAEIFSGGVYDTKYITEFKARFPASYLEYVFRKCQRDNSTSAGQGSRHVTVSYLKYPNAMKHMTYLPCGLVEPASADQAKLCFQFAHHGWCPNGSSCPQSHDVDKILDNEPSLPAKRRRRRKKRNMQNADESLEMNESVDNLQNHTENAEMEESFTTENNLSCTDETGLDDSSDLQMETADETQENANNCNEAEIGPSSVAVHASRTEGHRAGFDAFMTGFIFAHFIAKHGRFRELPEVVHLSDLGMQDYQNKITLTGKDIPLQIAKSNFAKTSKEHSEKITLLRNA